MDSRDINVMRSILRYDVNRAYIGDFTGAELEGAFKAFLYSQDWDKPIIRSVIHTGYIDGGVICRAVWNEMSYNPKRFGNVSPFLHNGKENIFYFCSGRNEISENTPGYDVILEIRKKMCRFLDYNKFENGKWCDVIDPSKGNMVVSFVSGCSDKKYKMLATLRDIMRAVISQNLQDLNRVAYRKEMEPVIMARHPNGVRAKKTPYYIDKILADEARRRQEDQARQERMDDAEDSAMITADARTQHSVPIAQYAQAVQDLEHYRQIRNQYSK